MLRRTRPAVVSDGVTPSQRSFNDDATAEAATAPVTSDQADAGGGGQATTGSIDQTATHANTTVRSAAGEPICAISEGQSNTSTTRQDVSNPNSTAQGGTERLTAASPSGSPWPSSGPAAPWSDPHASDGHGAKEAKNGQVRTEAHGAPQAPEGPDGHPARDAGAVRERRSGGNAMTRRRGGVPPAHWQGRRGPLMQTDLTQTP